MVVKTNCYFSIDGRFTPEEAKFLQAELQRISFKMMKEILRDSTVVQLQPSGKKIVVKPVSSQQALDQIFKRETPPPAKKTPSPPQSLDDYLNS